MPSAPAARRATRRLRPVAFAAACATACATALATALAATVRGEASAHPLHTSLAEISYDARLGAYALSIRVYADDFGAAVAARTGAAPGAGGVPDDAAIARYVASAVEFAGPGGVALPRYWCGSRRQAEALFLCVRVAARPAGLVMRNRLMAERFADQVNIVRATVGETVRTVLFTAGDDAKPVA